MSLTAGCHGLISHVSLSPLALARAHTHTLAGTIISHWVITSCTNSVKDTTSSGASAHTYSWSRGESTSAVWKAQQSSARTNRAHARTQTNYSGCQCLHQSLLFVLTAKRIICSHCGIHATCTRASVCVTEPPVRVHQAASPVRRRRRFRASRISTGARGSRRGESVKPFLGQKAAIWTGKKREAALNTKTGNYGCLTNCINCGLFVD